MQHIWITWEIQRRNKSLANALNAKLFEITYNAPRISRYIQSLKKTWELIQSEQPEIVFAQNPSLILSSYVIFLRKASRKKPTIVLDYHNAGVYPAKGQWLTRWAAKNADAVLVTNDQLAKVIKSWGATPLVVPDFLPQLHSTTKTEKPSESEFNILFICSWSEDEPIQEVVTAAEMLLEKQSLKIFITGKPKLKKYLSSNKIPSNVVLTGFLPEDEFDNLIHNSDVIIDLTTRDNCMVCGAYEAVSAGTPAILSDNNAMRSYFDMGMEFTNNSAIDIADKIILIIKNLEQKKQEILTLKHKIEKRQKKSISLILDALSKDK